jgi:hypothetical protein
MLLLVIVEAMPTIDFAMPIALFLVVTVALFLNKRVEGKLMATVEGKEFKTKDIILLIVFMVIVISVIAYTSLIAPEQTFQSIFLVIFLGSYTMLLFTFSYVFSNLKKKRAQLISLGFGVGGLAAGVATLIGPLSDSLTFYRAIAFFGFAAFCLGAVVVEQKKAVSKARWYIAVQPPALFVLLMVFFNVIYGGTTQVWYPILMDTFAFTFAILIVLYLSSLFSWKTVGVFAFLLTVMDIILVIGSTAMLTAATTFSGIGLPVLVYLPNVPLIPVSPEYLNFFGFATRGLGLGDFFFAGVLAVQTYKKFGKKTAIIAAIAMAVAFGIWEAFLGDIITALIPIVGRNIGGFPGTVMIISGWVPVVGLKLLSERGKTAKVPVVSPLPQSPADQNLPVQ